MLLFNSEAQAQDMIVYDENKNLELIFKYNPYEKENSIPNIFISRMAKSQSKIRSYYNYKISTKSSFILKKKKNNKYQIIIKIDSSKIEGNFNYKSFNFKNIIIPSNVYLTYNLVELNSNTKTLEQIIIPITKPDVILFDSLFTDSTKVGAYGLANEKLNYSYSENKKEDFEKAIINIDTYYKEGKKLDDINNEISKLNINNIDKIQLQSIDMKYLAKRYHKLKMSEYASSLSLATTDPAGIYYSYITTGELIDSLNNRYQELAKQLDSLLYAKAMVLSDSNNALAIKYFNKSLQVNPNNVSSIYQLALLDFKSGKLLKAEKKLYKILSITQNEIKANELANKTYVSMLDKAIEWNNEENYNESLNLLNEAKKFCKENSKVIVCNTKQEKSIQAAYYGMYISYVSIAGASIQSGKLKMTEDYLNTAYNYQQDNPQAIENTKEVDALYNLLVTEYLRNSLEAKNNFEKKKAEKLFAKADSISNKHSLNDASTFITEVRRKLNDNRVERLIAKEEPKFKTEFAPSKKATIKTKPTKLDPISSAQKDYKKHLKNGLIYLSYNRYKLAYPEFKEAQLICQQYYIKADDSLNSYTKQSLKPLILENIKEGELAAWGGKYKSAKIILKYAKKEAGNNGLKDDIEINNALDKLSSKINNRNNAIVSTRFNEKMQKARNSIEFKDFVSAERFCKDAIKIAKNNPQVNLNIDYPNGILKKYTKAIEFQSIYNDAMNHCVDNNADDAIRLFITADSLYKTESLTKYGLKANSFVLFISKCNSQTMTEYGIEFALTQNNIEDAYRIWKKSNEHEIAINNKLAISCISSIAKQDKITNKNGSKKFLFNHRFGDSKYFNSYKKYYYKSFKK
ncbi:MAG: hypothetical protein DRI86_12790 [Bacteroidetes bacterium]|nr:MAG: hypothetical protein DRI86_12790 [Bacteroidota bacterium]